MTKLTKKQKKEIMGSASVVRAPIPKPTSWHKDESKYSRRKKHKKGDCDEYKDS